MVCAGYPQHAGRGCDEYRGRIADPSHPTTSVAAQFAERGFSGPFTLFEQSEAGALLAELEQAPYPDTWGKGCAVTSPAWYSLSADPRLLNRARELIGNDILLSSSNLVEREPGHVHRWHVDTHLTMPGGGAATAWIGLRNVSAQTALHLVPGSHRYGFCPQECAAREGRDMASVTDDDILRWTRSVDPDAVVIQLDMADGDVVFFDGSLWHATHNTSAATRTAAIVHYSTPDKPVRMHEDAARGWPLTLIDDPLPPCILVSGSDTAGVNRLVPGPFDPDVRLSRILPVDDWFAEHGPDWRPDPLYLGSTRALAQLRIAPYEVLDAVPPHPAHTHAEEQLSIGLTGTIGVEIGNPLAPLEVDVTDDACVYLPPGTTHGLSGDSVPGSRMIDIAWLGSSSGQAVPLGVYATSTAAVAPDRHMLKEFRRSAVELVCQPTATLELLRILRVDMEPGNSDPEHVDAYDVVLVVRAGSIATLGGVAGVGDVVVFAAGEPHDLAVVGDEPVELLVVELHSRYTGRPLKSVRRMITRRLPQPLRMKLRKLRTRLSKSDH